MLGRKETLAKKVLDLNVYSMALSAKQAKNVMRIYIVKKHEKHIDCLVMSGNSFLGYRAIKQSRTLKLFDVKEEEVYDVYRYEGEDSYQLSFINVEQIYIKYMQQSFSFKSLVIRNEGNKEAKRVSRVAPVKTGITYSKQHDKLLDFIKENNTPITTA
jgi:ribosomal silencing factor RsfS